MTALAIVQALAKNVGISIPIAVYTSSNRDDREVVQLLNEVGEEVARRVDWGALQQSTTLTGDGTYKTFTLPADFDRICRGAAVLTGTTPLRALTQAEWRTLAGVEGTPRYFLLEGSSITLWPYLATGETVTVNYQSTDWASTGSTFTADDATGVVDEDLLLKGLIARWRRTKGVSYQDFEAEYEATLADMAAFDSRSRV